MTKNDQKWLFLPIFKKILGFFFEKKSNFFSKKIKKKIFQRKIPKIFVKIGKYSHFWSLI